MSVGSSSSWTDMDEDTSVAIDQASPTGTSDVHVVTEKDVGKPLFYDDSTLIKIASMPYRYCRVSIFKKENRYFYEPVVILDKEIVPSQHERFDGRVEVAFKIKLWDYDLERRIIFYLRNDVGKVSLKAYQVQVMPYEEVKLVAKRNVASFRVLSRPVCLLQVPVEVTFKILFSSSDEAELNANSEFLADHLELHFMSPSPRRLQGTAKQLNCDSTFSVNRSSVFAINVVSQSIGCCEDEEAIAKNFHPNGARNPDDNVEGLANEVCVPVFGVVKHVKIVGKKYVTFAKWSIPERELHGVFNLATGIFTVETSGTYLFQFEGLPVKHDVAHVQLKLNGVTKAESHSCRCGSESEAARSGSVSISCLLHVKTQDEVGIYVKSGELRDADSIPNATRFWGILMVADDEDEAIYD